MSIRRLGLLACCLASAVASADEQWEITTQLQMSGLPAGMPAQTRTVCVAPGEQSPGRMVPAEGCTVSNLRTTGSTSSFHLECPAPRSLSGDVRYTRNGNNAYTAEMQGKGDFNGKAGDIKLRYQGRKLGTCSAGENTANQANAFMAQQQALMAQQQAIQSSYMNMACQQIANELNYQAAPSMAPMCPSAKDDLCKVFASKTATADGLRALSVQRDDWREIAAFCGQDADTLASRTCSDSKTQRNWAAAVQFCGEDSELEQTAIKECTGLSFTSIPANDPRHDLRPLCSRYAAKIPRSNTSTGGAVETGKRAVENLNKLRGLFGH